jgi:predicted O-linked N-acetylglucosamine transferase (SPINDLY family)
LYEHEDAQDRFSEQLLRLPGLNHFTDKPPQADEILAALASGSLKKMVLFPGLPNEETPVIICAHTNVKYHPEYDEALSLMLQFAQTAVLVIMYDVTNQPMHQTLIRRMRKSIPDFNRILFVPFPGTTEVAFKKFLSMIAISEVILDPFPFGNGMTALDSFSVCTPSVTVPSRQSVLGLVAGFYKKMDIDGLVAEDVNAYAQLVAKVATNRTMNLELRQQICSANSVLYNNKESVSELEDALERLVRAEREGESTGITEDELDLL